MTKPDMTEIPADVIEDVTNKEEALLELRKLVAYFRREGFFFGHEGDNRSLSAAETAIHFMRTLAKLQSERNTRPTPSDEVKRLEEEPVGYVYFYQGQYQEPYGIRFDKRSADFHFKKCFCKGGLEGNGEPLGDAKIVPLFAALSHKEEA